MNIKAKEEEIAKLQSAQEVPMTKTQGVQQVSILKDLLTKNLLIMLMLGESWLKC